MAEVMHPLRFAPWTTDIDTPFYLALASLKINHDKLNSDARKVLGLYEIDHRDAPERSARMQITGSALTTDESSQGYYRGEGLIRNFNTIEEFRQVDKTVHIERAGRIIWEAIKDGTIYSCPSLLSGFSAICFADLKKYKFTYHFAYPALHSDPQWRLVSPGQKPEDGISKLGAKETAALVDTVQTWRYSVDTRQHGFFLAKKLRKEVLEAEWRAGRGEIEEEEEDGNLFKPKTPKITRSQSLGELGFLWSVTALSGYETGFFKNAEECDQYVCFADPSTYAANPGWMLRNLLVLIRQRWKLDRAQILCYRDTHRRRDHQASLILNLRSATPVYGSSVETDQTSIPTSIASSLAMKPGEVDASGELKSASPPQNEHKLSRVESPPRMPDLPKVTGWERYDPKMVVSRTVDLASYLDPTRLADQAVDLNLKLIKWRISPAIDLDRIKRTSCLLLGAGTLGSYVARNLMGWGVRKITFVDNARVSYSNPVRQPLYVFEDCIKGGVRKAERAAEALKEIYPGIDAQGHYMSIPMAGHPITDEARVKADFEKLQELIETHDAIFLLMDSRESRWLPSVMGKAASKIVINAALGFDSYVVMRHGVRVESSPAVSTSEVHESGKLATTAPSSKSDGTEMRELGCYFCSDVVAPGDSLKSATLDQQCTVTRPGVAPIASALAVELLVSVTQHRLGAKASAPPALTSHQLQPAPPTDPSLPNSHPLGTVPHQLRGFMGTWQTMQVSGPAFESCAACSPRIVDAYTSHGWEFVRRAINEKGFVEEVSGLAEVQREAEEAERRMRELEMDDDDDDFEDDVEAEGELV